MSSNSELRRDFVPFQRFLPALSIYLTTYLTALPCDSSSFFFSAQFKSFPLHSLPTVELLDSI